jgi:hypothetical protein
VNTVPQVVLACDPRCHATWPHAASWWTPWHIAAFAVAVLAAAVGTVFFAALAWQSWKHARRPGRPS